MKLKNRKILQMLIITYVISCLLVGGIIKSNALNLGSNDSFYVKADVTLNGQSAVGGWNYSSKTNNSRIIIYNSEELNDLIRENIESYYSSSGTVIISRDCNIDYSPPTPNLGYGISSVYLTSYSFFRNYLNEKGYISGGVIGNVQYIPNASYINQTDVMGIHIDGDIKSEIGYVSTYEDLIAYLTSGDDTIPNYTNPDNPPTNVDNALPVPQELSSTYKSGTNSYPPHLRGSWVNPENASFNAIKSDIYIEVQYKPKFQFYASNSLFRKKYKVVESSDYISIYNDKLEGLYQFVKYGAEDGFYPSSNEFSINSSYFNDIRSAFGDELQYINVKESTIDVGSKWRARYYYYNKKGDKLSSYWAVYNVNQKNPVDSDKNTVSFQDASGNPVSPDDVDYNNSTDTDTNDSNLTLLDRLELAFIKILGIFNLLSENFNVNNGFMKLFASTFGEFPEIYGLVVFGFAIVIILRIFGR